MKEIKDANINLVEIKEGKPDCILHGAMNRLTRNGIYRCVTTYAVLPNGKFISNNCKAGCELEWTK